MGSKSEKQDNEDSYLLDEESEIIDKSFDKQADTTQSIRKTLKDI